MRHNNMEYGKPYRSWFVQPGQVCDMRGYPIYPGDLLRSKHFRQRIGKSRFIQHYLYHVATYKSTNSSKEYNDFAIYMTPSCWLDPHYEHNGGECLLSDDLARDVQIIHGNGPGDILDFRDRKKNLKRDEFQTSTGVWTLSGERF